MDGSTGFAWGEKGRQKVMREDTALVRRHGLLMAALQAAVLKSQMLKRETIFDLSLVNKEAQAAVRQNIRAIKGDAKVRGCSRVEVWLPSPALVTVHTINPCHYPPFMRS